MEISNLATKSESTPAHSKPLPLQERVEAQGHLIDSHIMEQIFDTVVEFGGRFEVEQFSIGRTNSDGSYLRLKIDTDDAESMEKILSQLLGLGCAMVESGDAELFTVRAGLLRAGGFLFHHQPQNLRASRRPLG